ncbi:synaptophysin-like protein 1 [Ammospiza nelsoni]|uniref:synaptophysin-like protein 1 n=1 Tax=Ammospiza caudacuta TaxID=2857398 RepID=UPI002738BAE9|nr:synaptophysin-like protein 1 [Ammospiza caudacuta]XP_059347381.1 synaptophysin-like protein 1 [Ammospiza nelsoni]
MMAAPRVSLRALKEPLGLSRGLQWFFSIFAFATCGGFEGSVTFSVTCAGGDNASQVTNVTAAYGYPFRLNQAVFQPSLTHLCNHTWPRDVHLVGDFSSAARFFVGVAVGAFLYSLGALGLYLGYLHLYRCAGSRLPLMDLLLSALLAALWLCASCAWAQGLAHVRRAAAAPLPHCPAHSGDVTCARAAATPMGGLGASVAFGFLNLLLWAGGSWFVYKETPLHRPAPPPEPSPAPM